MSVYSRMRGESGVEYVDLAVKLYHYTLTTCMRLPKRWDRYILAATIEMAGNVMDEVVQANSIFVRDKVDLAVRGDHLRDANAYLQALDAKVGRLGVMMDGAKDQVEKLTEEKVEKILETFGEFINAEAKKISGVRKSDAAKKSKLPDRWTDPAK